MMTFAEQWFAIAIVAVVAFGFMWWASKKLGKETKL
jgi:type IV secretory pathway VirB2 component (pilin)